MLDLPSGVWAIASHIKTAKGVDDFIDSAADAACWCWRRPSLSGSEQRIALNKLTQLKSIVTHGMSDWASASAARAVICGVKTLPPSKVKQLFPQLLVGASVHNTAEVDVAIEEGVDFLVYGPVWDTPSKQDFLSARGLDRLQQVVERGTPVVAIGGVQSPEQVQQLKDAQVHAVAVLRASHDKNLMHELCSAFKTS
ncbi:MAG: thiamine-phosphate diphosphorylase [Myxococcota bacterium]|jgi:thiamine-phosphate diphosphorylase